MKFPSLSREQGSKTIKLPGTLSAVSNDNTKLRQYIVIVNQGLSANPLHWAGEGKLREESQRAQ